MQHELAALTPPVWRPTGPRPLVAGCFVCFRGGQGGPGWAGEPAWAAAVLMLGDRRQAGIAVLSGRAAAPYEPGLLALREGPLLGAAVRALPEPPHVVMVNASGRDHPRGAGLASPPRGRDRSHARGGGLRRTNGSGEEAGLSRRQSWLDHRMGGPGRIAGAMGPLPFSAVVRLGRRQPNETPRDESRR
jgi:hypothetical protein